MTCILGDMIYNHGYTVNNAQFKNINVNKLIKFSKKFIKMTSGEISDVNRFYKLTTSNVELDPLIKGEINEIEKFFPKEIKIATLKRDPEKSKVAILDKYDFYVGMWSEYDGPKTDALASHDLSYDQIG